MKHHFLSVILFVFCLYLPVAKSALPVEVEGEKLPSLAPMLERIQDSVVNISTSSYISVQNHPLYRHPFFREFFQFPQDGETSKRRNSLGSGVITDKDKGYVVTNYHLLRNADEVSVTLKDGRRYTAEIIGHDEKSDLAVIKIDADNLKQIDLGNADELRVGDFVVAIGSPFGLSQTVSSGIVSALGRSGLGIEGFEDFIQTDASINPGNSGGALVNLRGELVGINTAILSRGGGSIGIGFSIPVNMVDVITSQLIEYGEVSRGVFGAQTQDLNPQIAEGLGLQDIKGAVVVKVYPGSTADIADIKTGDVITAINEIEIQSSADLRNTFGLIRPGEKITLKFFRNKELSTKSVKIQKVGFEQYLYGLSLAEYYNDMLIIDNITADSPASESDLRVNDIVFAVNDRRISSVREFNRAVESAQDELIIFVFRNGYRQRIVIQK